MKLSISLSTDPLTLLLAKFDELSTTLDSRIEAILDKKLENEIKDFVADALANEGHQIEANKRDDNQNFAQIQQELDNIEQA
ncbi:hypothetical protein K4G60_g1045 [Candida parapsilosis]|nr:hypothetical protein K4G60_g1045 [Candida parapsilosis]KAI5909074.1 hypothetical protein K4G61_g2762 [Candida parapsilosis]